MSLFIQKTLDFAFENEQNNQDFVLKPLIKWTGGKQKELEYILPLIPTNTQSYFEPFVGGGAVYFSVNFNQMFINDKSKELIEFYKKIKTKNTLFLEKIEEFIYIWDIIKEIIIKEHLFLIEIYKSFFYSAIKENNLQDLINIFVEKYGKILIDTFCIPKIDKEYFLLFLKKRIFEKIKRMKKIDKNNFQIDNKKTLDNIEAGFKGGFYMYIRHIYNNMEKYNLEDNIKTALFFFIRNYSYAGMFRYSQDGNFNVPYGGIGYNNKTFKNKLEYFKNETLIKHLSKTVIENMDFEDFLNKHKPQSNDFIFLDPPYDSEFSTYDNNDFTKDDHKRLADYLINKTKAKWLMVIKETNFIKKLYMNKKLNIDNFEKKYLINFHNRNNRETKHLIIKNY